MEAPVLLGGVGAVGVAAMRRALIVLLLAGSALGQEKPPKPDTPEQAAEKVLAAFKAKDEAALKALADRDRPDPWLVAAGTRQSSSYPRRWIPCR